MRTAIITDIHGHYDGLLAAMADIETCACDRTLCLGDMVDGGDGSDAVVRFLRDHDIPTVFGNHDHYNDLDLAPDVQAFIDTLPETIVEGDALYTHISPRARQNKIADPYEAWNAFDETPARRIFVGHAHLAAIYGEQSAEFGAATSHLIQYNHPCRLDLTDRYLITVPAIGYSRDRIDHPRYCIYDDAQQTLELRLLDVPCLRF
ncbi:metallophosphatase family protein [Capsulimonas corticalis]|uniref:Metallophosphatase family protein n=2 Tax=Capsulimonas corticalis TaxID=2219043 RepID=A0A402CSS5_9BACT|nr:metallophosphatase family protein [Capsulimonas corticalis]